MKLTPKETAEEIVEEFHDYIGYNRTLCIGCALITAKKIYKSLKENMAPAHGANPKDDYLYHNQHWEQVIQELEKL